LTGLREEIFLVKPECGFSIRHLPILTSEDEGNSKEFEWMAGESPVKALECYGEFGIRGI